MHISAINYSKTDYLNMDKYSFSSLSVRFRIKNYLSKLPEINARIDQKITAM